MYEFLFQQALRSAPTLNETIALRFMLYLEIADYYRPYLAKMREMQELFGYV